MTEGEHVEKYATKCRHCTQNTSLLYEDEWICVACGCNHVKKGKNVCETSENKINFINRFKNPEEKIFLISTDVNKKYEGEVFNELPKVYQKTLFKH